MAKPQGHRRAAKARQRKGKGRDLLKYVTPRLHEGERGPVDLKGGFAMGSSRDGKSMCSRRRIDHQMYPVPHGGGTAQDPYHRCVNPGCFANV